MKTIMLCLNQLGIGGVETAVLNQIIQFKKKNYHVIVLAKDGIYRKKFEEEGATVIEFEFVVENQYDIAKIQKVRQIMKEYQVEQVHIHQFDCITVVFPACLMEGIPYVAYTHTGIKGIYDWFENSYPGFHEIFSIYFESAKKIITITESAKQENIEKYKIAEEKYLILPNSIDFNRFNVKNNILPTKINKFLIISRMEKEKITSIQNAISIFEKYYQKNKKSTLIIVGEGKERKKIEKEIKEELKPVITFLGQREDINQIIAQTDVVIALDRCILETIAMKRLAIISGYKEIKGIVVPEMIEKMSKCNFSGEGISQKTPEEVVREIEQLTKEQLQDILEKNYQYALEKLNSNKNIYLLADNELKKSEISLKNLMQIIMELQNKYANHIIYTDKVYQECKNTQKWLEEKIENRDRELENRDKEIKKKQEEIEQLYNSNINKIIRKVCKILGKNRKK